MAKRLIEFRISIHALLAESDLHISEKWARENHNFYPRSPCGERRCSCIDRCAMPAISIHALLAESDEFLKLFPNAVIDISIHALLAESDHWTVNIQRPTAISIHALLAESDHNADCNYRSVRPISIHALLAESDKRAEIHASSQQEFLSTLSLRRATHYRP